MKKQFMIFSEYSLNPKKQEKGETPPPNEGEILMYYLVN